MEKQGAEVVCIEPPIDAAWDWIPRPQTPERDAQRAAFTNHLRRIRNGFWYTHKALNSNVTVQELSAYNLPKSLGSFDIGLMASVLLHTRSPVGIMESVANLVTDSVIVADRSEKRWPDQPFALLAPHAGDKNNDTWWEFSPKLVQQFLALMGFDKQTVTSTRHLFVKGNLQVEISTIVASKD
jgi:O-methyltransferase